VENTDATLFRKKSRGTAVKGSDFSSSLSFRGFDRYTSNSAHPLKGRSHAVRKRLHRGSSVGPQRPIHQPGMCLSFVIANEERNVKWTYSTNGMVYCCDYCTFLKLIYCHVFYTNFRNICIFYVVLLYFLLQVTWIDQSFLQYISSRKSLWGLNYHIILQETGIFVLGAGSAVLLVCSHVRVLCVDVIGVTDCIFGSRCIVS
jgi:hypothetical protein